MRDDGASPREFVAAILLAAGESTRMGRPKSLLNWHGQALIEYQVREMLAGGADRVIAVLGHGADEVRPLAIQAGAQVVVNEQFREGRAGSIREGARAIPDVTSTIIVLNVDQPRTRDLISLLLRQHRAHNGLITVPSFERHAGHPLILSVTLLGELSEVEDETEGLRAVVRRHAQGRIFVPVNDPSVLLDLNHPSDYEAAIEALQ